ncbi:MAG: alpha/beta hydrolase-fold protein [Lentisphaeraceae bacterium]|nr:alpha/beta hydrolase-fold protein [Lentisphaeraceae bacterium]
MNPFKTVEIAESQFVRDELYFMTVKSKSLKGRGDISFYIPETDKKDLPMVILLHGVYGSSWSWAYSGGAHLTAKEMAEAGEIPEVILAMPSDGLHGDGTGYVTHDEHDFEKWIIEDVPAAAAILTEKFSSKSPLYICGLSMGGFGAIRLGAKHCTKFSGISAHSSATEFSLLNQFMEGDVWSKLDPENEDYSPLYWLKKNKDSLPPLRFDCGVDDFLIDGNRELTAALVKEGIEHIYEEFEGEHTWDYWQLHLRDSLKFLLG